MKTCKLTAIKVYALSFTCHVVNSPLSKMQSRQRVIILSPFLVGGGGRLQDYNDKEIAWRNKPVKMWYFINQLTKAYF